MPTIQMMKIRDQKERDLGTNKAMEQASADSVIRYKSDFEQRLKNYWKWCEENKIEPVKYPVV